LSVLAVSVGLLEQRLKRYLSSQGLIGLKLDLRQQAPRLRHVRRLLQRFADVCLRLGQ
jgi:hypothetical protein